MNAINIWEGRQSYIYSLQYVELYTRRLVDKDPLQKTLLYQFSLLIYECFEESIGLFVCEYSSKT